MELDFHKSLTGRGTVIKSRNLALSFCGNLSQHHKSSCYEMRRRTEASTRYEESHTPTDFATCLSLSKFVLRWDQVIVWIYVVCILLFTIALSAEGLAKEINRNASEVRNIAHSCYVCLSPEKSLAEAKKALELFSHETQQQISDCATFALNFSTDFVLPCPPKYVGCQMQIQGAKESRFCAQFWLSDCQKTNKTEHCFFIFCRAKLAHHPLITTESEGESKKVWQSSETDDEDLLPKPSNHLEQMQDDGGDVGSGDWEPPPGVILFETTTPKPTLIPNLRPDSRTTTPISTSGVENLCIRVDMWLVVSVLPVAVLI